MGTEIFDESTFNDMRECTDDTRECTDDTRECTDDTRELIRRQFYKKRIKKDNFKLEQDDELPQEQRRKTLLEYQKKYRDEAVNTARGILQNTYLSELDDEDFIPMDIEKYTTKHPKPSKHTQRCLRWNRMMLSEWMLEVPENFLENWIMVPCPIGKRTRLISRGGTTKAYSRKGLDVGVFPSALPGGNPNADTHHCAVLDCIWVQSQQVYYVLDVLYWGILPFTNCEAELRLYWINNKIHETKELEERDTDTNKYPILCPQHISCDSDLSTALTNLEHKLPLDGLLFYHRNGYYSMGYTPLVTWLKPFMLPEVLGIFVPSPLDEKPNDYINFEHHVQKMNSRKWMYTGITKELMDKAYV